MDPSSPLERSPRNSPSSSLSYRTSSGQPQDLSPSMDAPIPDDQHGADLPMNMTASVMLTGLPRDAHQALADVEHIDNHKGMHPIFHAQAPTSPTPHAMPYSPGNPYIPLPVLND